MRGMMMVWFEESPAFFAGMLTPLDSLVNPARRFPKDERKAPSAPAGAYPYPIGTQTPPKGVQGGTKGSGYPVDTTAEGG